MIAIRNLTIGYNQKMVLNDLSLDLEEGLVHGIVGLNGAGKTTLLHTMYGLIKPRYGTIVHQGRRMHRMEIGYLEAENHFYRNITGREYLTLFRTAGKPFDNDQWNTLFHLPLDALIETYSTGMRKKLALLAVIRLQRPVMILDEPFTGLDLETSRLMGHILDALRKEKRTIIVTSHILETLTRVSDIIHHLKAGTIVQSATRSDFDALEQSLFSRFDKTQKEQLEKILHKEEKE